jgi:hypothetical protein
MQPEAGEAEIDRQRLVELGSPVIKEIGGIGHRRRYAVADHVHCYRPGEEEAGMEHLHAEAGIRLGEQRPLRPEADLAPGVEIEPRQRLRQGRPCFIGYGRDLAGPAHDLVEAESRLRRRLFRLLRQQSLRRSGGAQCGAQPGQNPAAIGNRHDRSLPLGYKRAKARCANDLGDEMGLV